MHRFFACLFFGFCAFGSSITTGFAAPAPLQKGPVQVAHDGPIIVNGKERGRHDLAPPLKNLTVTPHTVAGDHLLRIGFTNTAQERYDFVFSPQKPKAAVIFSGRMGPLGVDGEWSRHLEIRSHAILKYQRRADLRRCDTQPAYLFVQLYDFKSQRFRPAEAMASENSLPTLVASRKKPAMITSAPMSGFRPYGASTLHDDQGQASNLRSPMALSDGDTNTVWAESTPGYGRSQFLVARRASGKYRLRALSIIPGDASSAKAFRQNNRLKSVIVSFSEKEKFRIRFEKDPAKDRRAFATPYWVVLPKPTAAICAQLTIEEVYRGKRGNRTAISEVQWYTELSGESGINKLIADLNTVEHAPLAHRILVQVGDPAIKAAANALGLSKGNQRKQLLLFLSERDSPIALNALLKSLKSLGSKERTTAFKAIERFGSLGAQQLAKRIETPNAEFSDDLFSLLGKIGGNDAERVLLNHVGLGEDTKRNAVVKGLVALKGPALQPKLLQRLNQTKDDAQRSDLIRVLSKRSLAPGQKQNFIQTLLQRWKSDAKFEERYRILHALANYQEERADGPLLAALGGEDTILRREAFGIAALRGDSSKLVAGLVDADPGVRLAAAIGLKESRTSHSPSLAKALNDEKWPVVAFALAEALGSHCSDARTALVEALNRPRHSVDRAALRSLIQCRGPYLARDLLAMGLNANWRTYLRKQALAGFDKKLAGKNSKALRTLFGKLRRRAGREPDDEEVALIAARALAQAGDKAAMEELANALALDPRPPIRAGAARVLSLACPLLARKTVERAAADSDPLVQRSARATLRKCRWK
jgi:HEAT repeat protein